MNRYSFWGPRPAGWSDFLAVEMERSACPADPASIRAPTATFSRPALRERAEKAEAERDAARAEREAAKVAAASAEGEARGLREALAEARRPFWRRWLG